MHAFKGKIVQRKSGGLPATAAKWRLRLAGWGVAAVAADVIKMPPLMTPSTPISPTVIVDAEGALKRRLFTA